ncbi:MAG: protein kinase, partial [Rhodobacterales bacterium]|nr:protein kinase [Rhodobacterales bacterium]
MSRLLPGQVLGDRFEIIGPLGRGGTATVWLVQDRIRGEQVALKVLHEHLTHDPSMRRRLRQEVQATARLDSKGALVCHDLHEVDGLLAVSMPYHAGRTLTEAVAADGPLDATALRALGVSIGGALSQAHQRGVLHRDVTPNNLMLDQGVAVLTDFGLATTHDGGTRTATSVMGTPGYAAPEVWHGTRRDPRSDLYGLGASLYYAATGEAPFAGQSPGQTLTAQLVGGPPSLADVRSDLPDDLVQTISALLEPQPDRRLQSASEVVEALETRIATEAAPEPHISDQQWPRSAGPTALSKGPWTVVVESRQRGRQFGVRRYDRLGSTQPTEQALRLTADLATWVGVSIEDLQPPTALSARRVRLMKGVDRETAQRLDELAEAAGYRAKLYNEGPETRLERAATYLWMPIPLMWIVFAFSGVLGLPQRMLLPGLIFATVLLSVVATPLRRRRVRGDVPLAFARDLGLALPEASAAEVLGAVESVAQTEPAVLDRPSSAAAALNALKAVEGAIGEGGDLPDV